MIPRTPTTPDEVDDAFLAGAFTDLFTDPEHGFMAHMPMAQQLWAASAWLDRELAARGIPADRRQEIVAAHGQHAFGADPWLSYRHVVALVDAGEPPRPGAELARRLSAERGHEHHKAALQAFVEERATSAFAGEARDLIGRLWQPQALLDPMVLVSLPGGTRAFPLLALGGTLRPDAKASLLCRRLRRFPRARAAALVAETWGVFERQPELHVCDHENKFESVHALVAEGGFVIGQEAAVERDNRGARIGPWKVAPTVGALSEALAAGLGWPPIGSGRR